MSVFIGGAVGAAVGTAAIGAGASIIGSSIASRGARDAAQTQADAANRSADIQQANYQQTQDNLKPYMDLGKSSINPLMAAMGYNPDGSVNGANALQQRFAAPSAADAAATPGYQFTLDQGLRSVQNSAAARGLGTSGAALKGAAGYATGLADSTYNDVYNRALSTFKTNYGSAADNATRLAGLVNNGQNAANNMGTLGASSSTAIGNSLMGGAQALASGDVGSANALVKGLGGISNAAALYGQSVNNAGSNVSQSALNTANASSDPIASLNQTYGWTGTQ